MKKFTDNINEKTNKFAADQKIYNDLYNLIEETLIPKMNGDTSENISLIGKEDLVKELAKIVENDIRKTKISVLEKYKKQPTIIQENNDEEDVLSTLINKSLTQEKTGYDPMVHYINEYFSGSYLEQTDEEFEEVYNNAPQEVTDLIDAYGDDRDYNKLAILKDELDLLGYNIDYGLDGQITYLNKKQEDAI